MHYTITFYWFALESFWRFQQELRWNPNQKYTFRKDFFHLSLNKLEIRISIKRHKLYCEFFNSRKFFLWNWLKTCNCWNLLRRNKRILILQCAKISSFEEAFTRLLFLLFLLYERKVWSVSVGYHQSHVVKFWTIECWVLTFHFSWINHVLTFSKSGHTFTNDKNYFSWRTEFKCFLIFISRCNHR